MKFSLLTKFFRAPAARNLLTNTLNAVARVDKLLQISYAKRCMELMSVVPATVLGYTAFHLTKYPHGKVGKKLPKVKVKNIELSPSIKLNIKDHTIHFHHWMNLAILLAISVPMTGAIWDSAFAKAFMVGGIIQGLTFKDANRIIHRKIHNS